MAMYYLRTFTFERFVLVWIDTGVGFLALDVSHSIMGHSGRYVLYGMYIPVVTAITDARAMRFAINRSNRRSVSYEDGVA
jgi:hypothetical protein